MQPRTRNLLIILGGLVVVVIIAVIMSRFNSSATDVTVQRAKLSRFVVKLPENGVVQHPSMQTIPALVGGNLEAIYVREGDYVNAGQLLAVINNPQVMSTAAGSAAAYQAAVAGIGQARGVQASTQVQSDAAVATAVSNLSEARRLYQANQNLFDNKAISRDTLDQARAKLDQAQVAYNQAVAQRQLNAVSLGGQSSMAVAQAQAAKAAIDESFAQTQAAQMRIIAPFSGQIQSVAPQPSNALRPIQVGDAVTPGQPLFSIAAGRSYIVRANVDEQDISQVRIGQGALISGQDFGGKTIAGHVASISPTAQKSDDPSSTSRQVPTVIGLDASAPFLKDGMSADVDIYTTDIPNALTVPNSAIINDHGKKYVFVVQNGTAHKRPVTTGLSSEIVTVIRGGISVGDEIVVKPTPDLLDGARVRVAPSESPAPAASPT